MTNTKLVRRFFRALALTVIGIFLAGCCSTPIEEPGHKIGEAIEGTYKFNDGALTGYLSLNDGQYLFIPEGDQVPEKIADRFSFVKHPRGSYSMGYSNSFDENTLLEDLTGGRMFARITFESEVSTGESQPFFAREFLIMSSKEARLLYFHSSMGEISIWSVTKDWD
ncbi:MAG: hypothetical protein AB8I69_12260 [Anaerolineae bacterium]